MKRLPLVLCAFLLLVAPLTAQLRTQVLADYKHQDLNTTSLRYLLRTDIEPKADSLFLFVKVLDSTSVRFHLHSTLPDLVTLVDTVNITPTILATSGTVYANASIPVNGKHHVMTLTMTARSTCSTTANNTTQALQAWILYDRKR